MGVHSRRLVDEPGADERGSVLARLAPGSIISRATVSLLSGRPARARLSASTEGAPVVDGDGDGDGDDVVVVDGDGARDGLDGLRGLAATLLLSLAPPEDAP
jgi:hypothetical protein